MLKLAVRNNHVELVYFLLRNTKTDGLLRGRSGTTGSSRESEHIFLVNGTRSISARIPSIRRAMGDLYRSLLRRAVVDNDFDKVRPLGPDVDAVYANGQTLLHLAVEGDFKPVVEVLLASDADRTLEDVTGKRARDLASDRAVIRILSEASGDDGIPGNDELSGRPSRREM